jgi:S-adenosylmethionine hydrolase
VIVIDRFGNAITNCLGLTGGIVEIAGLHLPVRRTYGDVDPGCVLALVGSSGLIEIAERDGNAARRLGLTRGTAVLVRR